MTPEKSPVEAAAWAIAIPVLNAAAFAGFTGWIGYCLARKMFREVWRP